eukprot:1763458-Heterocapsa_arctica.AAC.1
MAGSLFCQGSSTPSHPVSAARESPPRRDMLDPTRPDNEDLVGKWVDQGESWIQCAPAAGGRPWTPS